MMHHLGTQVLRKNVCTFSPPGKLLDPFFGGVSDLWAKPLSKKMGGYFSENQEIFRKTGDRANSAHTILHSGPLSSELGTKDSRRRGLVLSLRQKSLKPLQWFLFRLAVEGVGALISLMRGRIAFRLRSEGPCVADGALVPLAGTIGGTAVPLS